MLFSLVTQAAEGKKSALTQLKNALASTGSPTMVLVEDAVQNAGTDGQRATLLDQRRDFPWSLHMRMELQEFRTVLTDDVTFENGIRGVLSSAAFGYQHQRALLTGGTPEAKALLRDLNAVASEAAHCAAEVKKLRSRITPTLHALQVLNLMRAEAALDGWQGKRVMEVGCQDGGLFGHLRAQGVDVWALDLEPRFQDSRVLVGDFMKDTIPGGRFDVVLATAVFEFGSGWEHIPAGKDDVKLLQRLHLLLNPGGLVVMENIGCPVPFSAAAAREHGFDVVDTRTLVHNLAEGGRGCAIRRRA